MFTGSDFRAGPQDFKDVEIPLADLWPQLLTALYQAGWALVRAEKEEK